MLDRYKMMSIQLISLSSTSSSALYIFVTTNVGEIREKGKAQAPGMQHQEGRTRKKMLNKG